MLATVRKRSENPNGGSAEVTIYAEDEELAELQKALAVVARFKAQAMREAKVKLGKGDWVMTGFEVKPDRCRASLRWRNR